MKPTLSGSRYVLAVKNLAISAEFYKNNLGFETLWHGGGWHFLIRDEVKIMLGECPGELPASELGDHSYFAYIDVVNIDDIYNEFKLKTVTIVSDIEDKPWRQREFGIRTVDGHRIMFGEAISS